MNNRFGIKDFTLYSVLGLIIVLVLTGMYMVDRQWAKMSEMQKTLSEQANDTRKLRNMMNAMNRRLQRGAFSVGDGGEENIPKAFERSYQASLRPDYSEGDWLVRAFGSGLKTITPLISSDAYASRVQAYVLETLLTRDPETLEWRGLLAKDWRVSKDGLTFTFYLRDGLKFSDGHDLDAGDVVFSYQFIMNEKIAAPRLRAYYEKLDSVIAKSSNEVVFKFKEPYFNSMAIAGGLEILPEHFYKPYLQNPETFNQSKGLLLGSGPYRLLNPKSWTPDSGVIELHRNPRYWAPVQPSFDRLIWKIIENDAARLTTYRNGDIDLYSARPVEYKKLLADESLAERSRHLEYMSPVVGYSYIAWNQRRADQPTRFADKKVRQAMTYLTDRGRLINDILLGYAEVAISPFKPDSRQHDPDLKPRVFDLEKAGLLLKEAGYEDRDGDSVLEDVDGNPFEFELVYFQDSEDTKRIVLFLKDLYARAGIILKPKPTEWAVMLDSLDRKDFDAITLAWTSGVETDIFQMFHSSQSVAGGDNYISYKSNELDRLIDKARSTVDEDKRMPLWQAAERVLYEDQPYTFLMRRKALVFVDERMRNLEVTALGLNIETPVEWYVAADQQRYID